MLRHIGITTLFALALIMLLIANVLVWANRTVFEAESFVATTNRVLDQEPVQEYIADRLAGGAEVYLQQRLSEALPSDLAVLVQVLAAAARDALHDAAVGLLQDNDARKTLDATLLVLHDQVLTVLQGESALVVQDNTLIVDLRPILERALNELGLAQDTGGVQLPEGAGQIVVSEDAASFGQFQRMLSRHDSVTWATVLMAAVLVAGLAVATRFRRLRRTAMLLLFAGVPRC